MVQRNVTLHTHFLYAVAAIRIANNFSRGISLFLNCMPSNTPGFPQVCLSTLQQHATNNC